jgi:prepilin-type N-terminal cleavage/methylation domain-containing protein
MKKAYTLIELLIVISITGIIFGIGYFGFREFSRRQVLASTTSALVTNLRLAQERALAGDKPEGCSGNLEGYEVVFNSTSYTIQAVCESGKIEIKKVDLPEAIFLALPSVNPILFKVLAQGTNVAEKVEIAVSGFDKSQIVTVTSSGEISEGKIPLIVIGRRTATPTPGPGQTPAPPGSGTPTTCDEFCTSYSIFIRGECVKNVSKECFKKNGEILAGSGGFCTDRKIKYCCCFR